MGMFEKHTNLPENVVKILQEDGAVGIVPQEKTITDKKGREKKVFFLNARYMRKADGSAAYDSDAIRVLEETLLFDEKTPHVLVSFKDKNGKNAKTYLNMLGQFVEDPSQDLAGKTFHEIVTGKLTLDDFRKAEGNRAIENPSTMLFSSDKQFRDMLSEYLIMQIHAKYMQHAESFEMTYDQALKQISVEAKALEDELKDIMTKEKDILLLKREREYNALLEKLAQELSRKNDVAASEVITDLTAINLQHHGSRTIIGLDDIEEKLNDALDKFQKSEDKAKANTEKLTVLIEQTRAFFGKILNEYPAGKPAPTLATLKKLVNYYKNLPEFKELASDKDFDSICREFYTRIEKNNAPAETQPGE